MAHRLVRSNTSSLEGPSGAFMAFESPSDESESSDVDEEGAVGRSNEEAVNVFFL